MDEKSAEEIAIEPIREEKSDTHAAAGEGKKLAILIAIIVGIFVVAFFGFNYYNGITGAVPLTIDDLHAANIAGELDEEEGQFYNGYSFVKADGLWWTEFQRLGALVKIPLHFSPEEVEEIPVVGELKPIFNVGEEVIIAIDPLVQDKYYSLGLSELSLNVAQGIKRTPVGSCTEENWACDNRTIITCDTNTYNRPMVELRLGEETGIEYEMACIIITGSEYDFVKAVDKVLYQWYGIME
jgi:hypothetical protein